MAPTVGVLLGRLERASRRFGADAVETKLDLLRATARRRMVTPRQLLRLHEVLCFLRAYPDDADVLAVVDALLADFARRPDLRRHRAALADSGVAGTVIRYPFFWPQAQWLARRWPEALWLEWGDEEHEQRLRAALPVLVAAADRERLAHRGGGARRALETVQADGPTDATRLNRLIAEMPGDDRTREAFHDAIDSGYRIEPGAGTPSRTLARVGRWRPVFRRLPPSRERPDLPAAIGRPPRSIRQVRGRLAGTLIELSREAMVTRSRELEVFSYANPDDLHVIDDGDGLRFACMGLVPERRLLMHAAYGMVTLRNGVPIGYVQLDALGRSVGVSYNTFETFRGGEAAWVFGRVLAAAAALFGAGAFSIEPYQLGRGNAEGIASGAWWFYYKLGFRPRDRRVQRLADRELSRMRRDPKHRSSARTLAELASAHLFFDTDPRGPRLPPPPWIFQTVTPRRAPSLAGWSVEERRAWRRWAPIVDGLPGVGRWSAEARRRLTAVIRAKGGPSELPFLEAFAAHASLQRALVAAQRAQVVSDPSNASSVRR